MLVGNLLKNVCEQYILWKRKIDKDYEITIDDKNNLNNWFKTTCVQSNVTIDNNNKNVYGFFGILPINSNSTKGLNLTLKTRKKVAQVDMNNNEIVKVFDSLTKAAISVNRHVGTLSADIKFNRPIKNFIYKYI